MLRKLSEVPLDAYFQIPGRNVINRGLFQSTKLWTDLHISGGVWPAWSDIGDGIFLSKIPAREECDAIMQFVNKSQGKPLKLVVSVTDYYELGGSWTSNIATPEDWAKRGIQHRSLPIQDFGATAVDECIVNIIMEMRRCIREGNAALVHCKAGRSRSAMLCIIYFATLYYPELDAQEAYQQAYTRIQSKRAHISLDNIKSDKAKEVIQKVKEFCSKSTKNQEIEEEKSLAKDLSCDIEHRISEQLYTKEPALESKELLARLDNYISSVSAKMDIAQMVYFKGLAIYAAYNDAILTGKAERSEIVRSLFNRIHMATNAEWYRDYYGGTNKLQDFIAATQWDTDKCKKLVDDFYHEITEHLCQKLGCTTEELLSLSIHSKHEETPTIVVPSTEMVSLPRL